MKMNIISFKKPWLNAAMFVLAVTSLSSCLKNTGPIQDFGQSPALVSFQYKGTGPQEMVASIPLGTDDSVGIEVTLSVASLTLSSPVTVTLALDPDSLAIYNATNGTTYTMLDPSTYTTPANMQITIAPGQQIVPFVLHINESLIDFTTDPVLVFRIASVTGATIATNLRVIVVPIKLKNPYEGTYAVTGYFNHPSAPRYINQNKSLSTVNPIRSEGQVGDLGSLFQFDVDPTNALVNFVNTSADLVPPFVSVCCTDNSAGNAGFPGPPYTHTTYNNTYDPATHTFWMHYGYRNLSREIYEKWVLVP